MSAPQLSAIPRDERPAHLKQVIDSARADMAARLAAGAGGLETARALSAAYDAVVRESWAAAMAEVSGAASADLALVATGGWGREHMCPQSDIDFIVLTPKPRADLAQRVADQLLYPLWDAGIRVGHAVRAPDAAAKLARDDLATATSLLDARYLAGNTKLVEALSRATARIVARERNANDFVARLVEERDTRHDRFGASLYRLEPNLKQGIGALRDLATGVWAAQARWGVSDLDELVARGQISGRQAGLLTGALDFLLRVRSLLHLQTARPTDQLTFEVQEAIAPGLEPDARLPEGDIRPAVAPAVEALMRRYFWHARHVVQVTDRLLEYALVPPRKKPRILKIDRNFVGFNGKLSARDPALFREEPAEIVRLFRVALDMDMPVYAHTREVIHELMHDEPGLLTGNQQAGALFMDALLDTRDRRRPSLLEQMHDLEIVNSILPEFAPCTCRVQHDLYHVYTVDQHQMYAVQLLKKVARGELADTAPNITEAVRSVKRPVSLFLATLLHDVGKPHGKGHAETGAVIAREVGTRLGLDEEDVHRAEYLVRQHLTMAHLSQRRDLSDDAMIARFADQVGDEESLKQLFVLTYCDTAMTAPGNLTDWKGQLLRELYVKALAVLHGATPAEQSRSRASEGRRKRTLVVQQCEDEGSATAEDLAAFFEGIDDRYFAQLGPRQIATHYQLSKQYAASEAPVVLSVRHLPSKGHSEVAVVSRDTCGFLAAVAGVLAAHRIDVLGARVGSRRDAPAGDALALDVFSVRDGNGEAISPDDPRWGRIETDLASLFDGRSLDLERAGHLLAKKRPKSGLAPRVTPEVPTEIKIDNTVSDEYTVIDVYSEDHVGVLFAITHTITHLGLDVFLSRVATEGHRVADTFYVKQAGDPPTKIVDEARLDEIRVAIAAAIEEVAD